jgi:hypothetical protein
MKGFGILRENEAVGGGWGWKTGGKCRYRDAGGGYGARIKGGSGGGSMTNSLTTERITTERVTTERITTKRVKDRTYMDKRYNDKTSKETKHIRTKRLKRQKV